MTYHRSSLESLPNEILIDLFEYFDARDLYQAFYNINIRFNSLLQSLPHLHLNLHDTNGNFIDYNMIFSSQIYTLLIYSRQDIKLNQFFNLHCLTLWFPTDEQILQINPKSFPYLEYLSVSFTVAKASICSLYQKIFSNDFPSLKSCFLSGRESPVNTNEWDQSPNLQYLHITSNYPSILTSCPNLDYLNLTIPTLNDIRCSFKPHLNITRMRLILTSIVWLENDKNFEIIFSSMPNIERFSLHKIFSITNPIDILFEYDWLSSIITACLPLLKQFTYHLYIFNLFNINQTDVDKHLPQLKKNFCEIYKNHSDFFLKIKQYNS